MQVEHCFLHVLTLSLVLYISSWVSRREMTSEPSQIHTEQALNASVFYYGGTQFEYLPVLADFFSHPT